jgi:catechol 2,3-dioxygenase-like lactoylglutathione lyase family enzyme
MPLDPDAFAPYVLELFVSDLSRSLEFYRGLDFRLKRQDDNFAVLGWKEEHWLFLAENKSLQPAARPRINLRLMVSDVDAWWQRISAGRYEVHLPIGDRFYGLRDFTLLDPDGFGIRFASPLRSSG